MASNKRERELARMRAERQAARRAMVSAQRQKRRNTVIAGLAALSVAAVVVFVAISTGDGKDSIDASGTPTTAPTGACTYTPGGTAARDVGGTPPADGAKRTGTVPVAVKTNLGEIGLGLDSSKAPCTTNSFLFLAGKKYYDGTACHRLTTGGIFVLQCGDPSGTGSGTPGYQFADENLTGLGTPDAQGQVVYPRGTLAMANGGPGTNGSQFFLVYKDSPLPPSYTPFGTITKGLDLLEAVAKAGSTPVGDGKPNTTVTIETVSS